MSSGLMSCVRENSPPLEVEMSTSGPISLPEHSYEDRSELFGEMCSPSLHSTRTAPTPMNSLGLSMGSVGSGAGVEGGEYGDGLINHSTEHQKRRRFHPLRNLRRIFRRRTITTPSTVGAANNTASEKNLRSATPSSITSVVSASSPSSPLTHQQIQDAYLTQSLPKTKASYLSLLGSGSGNKRPRHEQLAEDCIVDNKVKSKHKQKQQRLVKQEADEELSVVGDIIAGQRKDQEMFTASTNYHQHHSHHHHQHQAQELPSLEHSDAAVFSASDAKISQRQSLIGVPVYPNVVNRNFFTERQKLRTSADSSQDLDSGNDSGTGGGGGAGHNSSSTNNHTRNGCISTGEMSDSQCSLSVGRLVDSDFSRDGLSHSHDSVFSESATASSLSIVLKAELADVLRKRRNRPNNSEEDLGLPHSPASPQRRAHYQTVSVDRQDIPKNQSDVSSLSLLSVNSTEGDDILAASTPNNSLATDSTEIAHERSSRYSRSSTTSVGSDILRRSSTKLNDPKDEVDLFSPDWTRLSHSAAKHKMAIRPTKKKGPSRQHRRTLETSIPEGNEELNKFVTPSPITEKTTDMKTTHRSLLPNTNNNQLDIPVRDSHQSHQPTIKDVPTTSSPGGSLFGLRTLTAKATAIFEAKEAPQKDKDDANRKPEVHRKPDLLQKVISSPPPIEAHESGFLRRLMQRNSKRSFAKCKEFTQDYDNKKAGPLEDEPKKVQVSTSCYETRVSDIMVDESVINKSRSEISHDSNIEEMRREIKREINAEGKSGLSAMLNSYILPSVKETKREDNKVDKSMQKPKSGPAARQRYVPQNISNESLNSLEKPKLSEELTVSRESILLKSSSTNESFQSTSIIKEIITQALQSPPKHERHYERKPKIVGLSAFQQKISRSSDSFGRGSSTNTSLLSLDKNEEDNLRYEQKQRKAVEKSKSFRSYADNKEALTSSVHNNMPSLPDLTLNVRGPLYREFILNEKECSSPSPPEFTGSPHQSSLGFQINDNKLVRGETRGNRSESNYDKNIMLTTSTTASSSSLSMNNKSIAPNKLMASTVMVAPHHSPSTTLCNKNISEIESNIDMIVKSPFVSILRKSVTLGEDQVENAMKYFGEIKTSPEKHTRSAAKTLRKEKSASEERLPLTSATNPVILREKVASAKVRAPADLILENDRKSAPSIGSAVKCNKSFMRRTSNIEESCDLGSSTIPEFMKIQLNRVEPGRILKSNLILAKNVKEMKPTSPEFSPEKTTSTDDLSTSRSSNNSADIKERVSPESMPLCCYEAINRQAKIATELPPRSPVKKPSTPPAVPTKPPTPTNVNSSEEALPGTNFKLLTFINDDLLPPLPNNSLSLQERKRLFMANENLKTDKNRDERKKSLPSEDIMARKISLKLESDKKDPYSSSSNITNNNHFSNNNGTKDTLVDNGVVMRKKAFVNNSTNAQSVNGHTVAPISSNSKNNKDDNTPELMKVFARRSLKIKDEDLDKILGTTTINNNGLLPLSTPPQSVKKFYNGSAHNNTITTITTTSTHTAAPNVDSDKENHSASEEKLDKLPKLENELNVNAKLNGTQNHFTVHGGPTNSNGTNIRNSVADFRCMSGVKNLNTQLILNNNYMNNNGGAGGATKSFLPSLKGTSFRSNANEYNNNHINNNNLVNTNLKSVDSVDKSTVHVKLNEAIGTTHCLDSLASSKTMERSATVGEFKGIHQRRAEWEQRAKEALK